jgi:hypothetical protein
MTPEYWLIKLPERGFWSEEIQAKTTEIWGVYAFARNQTTRVCEITTSYCLMHLGAEHSPIEGLSEKEIEKLSEDIAEGASQSEPVTYMHERAVENLLLADPSMAKKVSMEFDIEDCSTDTERWNAEFDQLQEGWNTGALSF